jgi:hypothetical protein
MAIIKVYQPPIVCPLIVLEATVYMLGILSSTISYLQGQCWSTKRIVMKLTSGRIYAVPHYLDVRMRYKQAKWLVVLFRIRYVLVS